MLFINEYKFLSNFSAHEILIDGVEYPTVEHYYQAMKTVILAERLHIISLSTAGKAKREGRKVTMRDGWDMVKDSIMMLGIKSKFDQHPELIPLLLSVDEEIVEDNNWGDTYWGKVNGKGYNVLGQILTSVAESYTEGD